MRIQDRIDQDLKQAMRDRNVIARETLRMVLAELKNKRIEAGRELEESEREAVLMRCVKTRLESAKQYDEGGRPELAGKEREEIKVIEGYLPEQMSPDEIRAAVAESVAEAGATSKKDMGAVMKVLMSKYKGKIDGRTAQTIASELLDQGA